MIYNPKAVNYKICNLYILVFLINFDLNTIFSLLIRSSHDWLYIVKESMGIYDNWINGKSGNENNIFICMRIHFKPQVCYKTILKVFPLK